MAKSNHTKTPYKVIKMTDSFYCVAKGKINVAFCQSALADNKINAEFIATATNNHDKLIRALKKVSQYLDHGNYPENKTQYELVREIQSLLKAVRNG